VTKASDLLVAALENEGVEYIFAIPGEENLDVLESLRRSKIKLVLTRHEQAAGFMAATYGRLTGRAGVCLTTLGPGALNLTTAAAYAHLGAMPMVMITGQKAIRRPIQCSWLQLPRSRVPPIFAFLPCSAAICVPDRASGMTPAANRGRTDMTVSTERAVLAGGCFWGVQDLLRKYPGVISTRVGYSGGEVPNATYRNHGNHAEAVEIIFDPKLISFRKLLEFFFQIHDPSTLNRQGNDRGASYRSAIFYTSDEQKRIAEDTIADVDASGLWPGKVVTEVAPAGPFWEAEPEHQDYLEKYPDGYTCHFVRPEWTLPHRAEKVAAGGGVPAA